jgi:hypothetical protein
VTKVGTHRCEFCSRRFRKAIKGIQFNGPTPVERVLMLLVKSGFFYLAIWVSHAKHKSRIHLMHLQQLINATTQFVSSGNQSQLSTFLSVWQAIADQFVVSHARFTESASMAESCILGTISCGCRCTCGVGALALAQHRRLLGATFLNNAPM